MINMKGKEKIAFKKEFINNVYYAYFVHHQALMYNKRVCKF